MGVPASSGMLRNKLKDMKNGDYIVCNYQAANGAVGTFSNFGGVVGIEIPTTGTNTPNGTFYFIKVNKGILVADRYVQTYISWNTLNTGKMIQGLPWSNGDVNGIIRSLTGGCRLMDANGLPTFTSSLVDNGCFPNNNEYDTYIRTSTLSGKVTPDSDSVWHHTGNGILGWCQETPGSGTYYSKSGASVVADSANRIGRGKPSDSQWNTFGFAPSTTSLAIYGFRPVFEYKEV